MPKVVPAHTELPLGARRQACLARYWLRFGFTFIVANRGAGCAGGPARHRLKRKPWAAQLGRRRPPLEQRRAVLFAERSEGDGGDSARERREDTPCVNAYTYLRQPEGRPVSAGRSKERAMRQAHDRT
jgi:hypothetical protein